MSAAGGAVRDSKDSRETAGGPLTVPAPATEWTTEGGDVGVFPADRFERIWQLQETLTRLEDLTGFGGI